MSSERTGVADSLRRSLPAPTLEQLGSDIVAAERTRTPRRALTDDHPHMTVADAYAIQQVYGRLRTADGARLVGNKIGCTSEAIQRLFGIDVPDYGLIFDDMVVTDGVVDPGELIQPMVEPEVAFELGADLRGPGITPADVRAATSGLRPCLEVIDSRLSDWRIQLCDTIADNGSSARVVFGDGDPSPLGDRDLAAVEVSLRRNDEPPVTGTGAAVLGDPVIAVAWLANAIGVFGGCLLAGSFVLSGSVTTAIRGREGDRFTARVGELGDVGCVFSAVRATGGGHDDA